MKAFDPAYTRLETVLELAGQRRPNFENLLQVLHRKAPPRPTLFEFFLNEDLYHAVAGMDEIHEEDGEAFESLAVKAFYLLGYDYGSVQPSEFAFPNHMSNHGQQSRSLNDGVMITDRESFNAYSFMEPEECDYSRLDRLAECMPEGMKIIVRGPGGVLENVIALMGYDNLCYLLADDEQLVADLFDAVGSRLVRFYDIAAGYDSVGALISNDDWGFHTQTMLSVKDMRRFVVPWHEKIVEVIHGHGKPALMHSCGQLDAVMDDIIDRIGFEGKHSYEDKICPVEQAYETYHERIAILGGLDLDYVCRRSPKEVYDRACGLLERSAKKGGYALGTGNSIPKYVPWENFFAMLCSALANEF